MARYDNIEIRDSNKKRVVQCEHFVQIHHVTLLSRKKSAALKKFSDFFSWDSYLYKVAMFFAVEVQFRGRSVQQMRVQVV